MTNNSEAKCAGDLLKEAYELVKRLSSIEAGGRYFEEWHQRCMNWENAFDESQSAPAPSVEGKQLKEIEYKDIDHEAEREIMIQAFDKVRQLFEGRVWVMDGRGSYPYNDDRYRQEVRFMYDEFDEIKRDTWKNIESKTFEYRNKIIENYKAELVKAAPSVSVEERAEKLYPIKIGFTMDYVEKQREAFIAGHGAALSEQWIRI